MMTQENNNIEVDCIHCKKSFYVELEGQEVNDYHNGKTLSTKCHHCKKRVEFSKPVEFDPKKHVKEYKRKCNECGKVWHTLAAREKEVEKQMKSNNFQILANCCNPGAQLQAKRNVEAGASDLNNLKKCPDCEIWKSVLIFSLSTR